MTNSMRIVMIDALQACDLCVLDNMSSPVFVPVLGTL